jgi:hypothetical protein
MAKIAFRAVLAAAAVTAIGLMPTAASAATAARSVPNGNAIAYSYTAPGGGDPDTTVTFTVTSGALSMTAPASADLGSGAPGSTISGSLGAVTVFDNRALLAASWIVTAAASGWITGTGTGPETIAATDVQYDPGSISTTGVINATGTPITLAGSAATVVTGTSGVGNNTATWNPTLSVSVPSSAPGGVYTGTLSHSVS